jgi:hypothetical protein
MGLKYRLEIGSNTKVLGHPSMRSYVIAFVLVLFFTCWVNGMNSPPDIIVPGRTGIQELGYGSDHDDFLIPEIKISDGYRTAGVMTKINDGNNENEIEFPYNAGN